LLAVISPSVLQNSLIDAPADFPEKRRERVVRLRNDSASGLFDQGRNFGDQRLFQVKFVHNTLHLIILP
jgi:hypothetical protein